MYNDVQLVYKVIICALFGISLWTEKVALNGVSMVTRQHFINLQKDTHILFCVIIFWHMLFVLGVN